METESSRKAVAIQGLSKSKKLTRIHTLDILPVACTLPVAPNILPQKWWELAGLA